MAKHLNDLKVVLNDQRIEIWDGNYSIAWISPVSATDSTEAGLLIYSGHVLSVITDSCQNDATVTTIRLKNVEIKKEYQP